MNKVGVIGGGAWGTALAQVCARAGREVTLWAREPDVVEAINARHENSVFLAGLPLDPMIRATADLEALAASDLILAFGLFRGHFSYQTEAVWLTYGPGQMLIVFSALSAVALLGRTGTD